MQSSRSPVPGIILIVLGVAFLIANFAHYNLESLWPIFVLAPGVAFLVLFFRERTNYGLLMPGTILTVIGLLFFVCTMNGWQQMEHLWPLFMMAPGLGFLMMYFFGKRERGFLVPAGILTGLGLIFLLNESESEYVWPIVLILLGLLVLLRGTRKQETPATQTGGPQGPSAPAP